MPRDRAAQLLTAGKDVTLDGPRPGRILILGVGNYIMGDEGVGVHVIQHMQQRTDLPDYIDLLDGGTGGFALMNVFDVYDKVILVDATMDGRPPGTVRSFRPRFASDYPKALSAHDIGLKDMIEALYLQDRVPEIHVVTISVESIQPMSTELTAPIAAAVPHAVQHILWLAEQIHSA